MTVGGRAGGHPTVRCGRRASARRSAISEACAAEMARARVCTSGVRASATAASAMATPPSWWAIISRRKIRSASTPVARAQLVELGLGGHARHRAVGRGVRLGVLAAHPGHRGTAAGLRQAPLHEPAVHLAGLLLLAGEDVVRHGAQLLVLAAVAREEGHLDGLGVVGLHVAGEPRVGAPVGGRGRARLDDPERAEHPDEQGDERGGDQGPRPHRAVPRVARGGRTVGVGGASSAVGEVVHARHGARVSPSSPAARRRCRRCTRHPARASARPGGTS